MRSLSLMHYFLFVCCLLSLPGRSPAQDTIYVDNIASPQLYVSGNQLGYPVLKLNGGDKLELHFDDLDGDVKNYYYTFQLCNSDWSPAIVSQFDYIRGFAQVQITDYQFSSVALTHYTHYKATLPDRNCAPSHSGNFVLKVFLDGDTSKMAFSRRFLVVDPKMGISAQVLQPLDNMLLRTHQRLQFNLNTTAVNPSNPLAQIKVVILQNYRWDNALKDVRPTIYVDSKLQYNADDILFSGGAEWRWADLQSFRFQSDRVQRVVSTKNATEIFLKPDGDRSQSIYIRYKDYNGQFFLQTTESINPLFQTDYATVHFYFVPPGKTPFPDKDVYLFGSLTDYGSGDYASKMKFNTEKGMYETALYLKMGYYSYGYATIGRDDPARRFSTDFTEGSHMETENAYTILVYYRALGGRADELVGMTTISSITGRPGF